MTEQITPIRLELKKTSHLEIDWQDGRRSVYTIAYLRSMCPCAQCRMVRHEESGEKKPLLRILPGNWNQPITAASAELVGNYALRIEWSDNHATGIYSYHYLRAISPPG